MQPLDTRYYNDDLVVRTKIEDHPISYIRYFPGQNNEPVIADAGSARKILVVGMNMSALNPSIFGAHTPYQPYPGVVEQVFYQTTGANAYKTINKKGFERFESAEELEGTWIPCSGLSKAPRAAKAPSAAKAPRAAATGATQTDRPPQWKVSKTHFERTGQRYGETWDGGPESNFLESVSVCLGGWPIRHTRGLPPIPLARRPLALRSEAELVSINRYIGTAVIVNYSAKSLNDRARVTQKRVEYPVRFFNFDHCESLPRANLFACYYNFWLNYLGSISRAGKPAKPASETAADERAGEAGNVSKAAGEEDAAGAFGGVDYRTLQRMAKNKGVRANGKRKDIIGRLKFSVGTTPSGGRRKTRRRRGRRRRRRTRRR